MPRTDHAAVDHPLVQVGLRGDGLGIADLALLVLGEHRHVLSAKCLLDAIGKADSIGIIVVVRRLHDNTDRTLRMQNLPACGRHISQGHDLRADGKDQMFVKMDSFSHRKYPRFLCDL